MLMTPLTAGVHSCLLTRALIFVYFSPRILIGTHWQNNLFCAGMQPQSYTARLTYESIIFPVLRVFIVLHSLLHFRQLCAHFYTNLDKEWLLGVQERKYSFI